MRRPRREPTVHDIVEVLPLLEAIVSYIDEGVMIADRADGVIYMNPSACQLLDIPPNTPIRHLRDVPTVDLDAILTEAKDARGGGSGCQSLTFEQRIPSTDGSRYVRFDVCTSSQSEGGLRLFIMRDITQRKTLEAYLNRASGDLITNDPKMLEILQRVEQVAPTNAAVLLQGESGTGKTHVARVIHRLSRRASGPLVEVNCAAIPETLLESELFGHVKGAFTGATQNRKGRFQAAHTGTLFLDEVGEIPMHLQAKLLRAIQEGAFEPVGSDEVVRVDVRIIAASNRSLRQMVDDGEFRSDLYYRLSVIPIYIPALRERPGDIPLLLKHFCYNLGSRGYPENIECSPEALRLLMDYSWPGNVRELANAVEHAIICAERNVVRPESLPLDIRNHQLLPIRNAQSALQSDLAERAEIEAALQQANGNRSLAAERLGIDRTTLWRRMQRLKMASTGPRPRVRSGSTLGR